MLVPNTNTRARCTGDDESAPLRLTLTLTSYFTHTRGYKNDYETFSHVVVLINTTTGGSAPPRVPYGSSNTETRQELHGRRWSERRPGKGALESRAGALGAVGARARARAVSYPRRQRNAAPRPTGRSLFDARG